MAQPATFVEVMKLVGKAPAATHVVYLGTATYDAVPSRENNTGSFAAAGCTVYPMDVAHAAPSVAELKAELDKADVVIVSGMNGPVVVNMFVPGCGQCSCLPVS